MKTPNPLPSRYETVPLMTVAPASPLVHIPSDHPRQRAGSRRFAAILVMAFAVSTIGMFVAPGPTDAWSGGQFSSTSERQLVALTNQSRAASGLRALRVDSTLSSVARSRSKDMIVRNYFSHNIPPSGKQVFSLLDSKGYCYAVAGENIGWNTYPDDASTKTIHKMFMGSSGHRSNILGKRWDVVGIGAYKSSSGKKMWTVLFADKCGSSGGTTPKPKPKPVANPATKPVVRPKATPAPTPKPTPVPTPVRTMPPEPTDPIGLGYGPGDRTNSTGDAADSPRPAVAAAPASGSSLRVVDGTTTPGLVETIVGDVTGFLFGG